MARSPGPLHRGWSKRRSAWPIEVTQTQLRGASVQGIAMSVPASGNSAPPNER